ncbi:2-oxoacid dehydrogenases acyltransferase [Helicosporidium sp. ATCC 50920]|nr:2-oxoacid dehydrogenases acyltransferase [Helicosporidium sp. ATCC 50920]|eukprot:KDD72047.1 2-oxoacid dehydrogenases acyltransferase [Helicosporidium sp. ATCC 50920]
MALRSQVRDDPAVQGQKLTFMPFFIKAASLALESFPLVNSSLAPDGQSVLQHRTINVGVAVATPHGLAVPNIKHVERLSILEIAAEMTRLHEAALRNALKPADVQGGTFTLSNIGTVGGTYATPLVNGSEVAIMALGRVSAQPRFAPGSDAVQRAHLLNVSLGADHRVVDGAMLAGFAQAWRRFVEQPGRMLLQLR